MTPELREIGRIAYEAYCQKTGGFSLATGDKLPECDDLRPAIREAWGESASAVATHMKARAADAFYGYARVF